MEPLRNLRSEPERKIVPDAVALELYKKMVGVYYIEERLKILTRQGKISFLASTRGHEKAQVGTVMMLKPRHDWFFPYYREKAIAYALGMPLKTSFSTCSAARVIRAPTAATCPSISLRAN